MAELERGTSTSATKTKSPPIDEDFGKDFLSSWKSSKAGKHEMEFDVETVPRNGKSSFNFDKLDDFDLGGDFEKISSFQMDMSDLDFSGPLKKTAKANKKEPHLGKQDLKKDKFSFTFDFDELDKFDLDTKLAKTEMTYSKCTDDSGPHCSGEVLQHDKHLDCKRKSVPSSLPLDTESLSTSTSAHMLEPDGPHDTVTEHGSAPEALPQIHKLICLDSVKGNSSKEQENGVRSLDSSQSKNSSPVKSSNSRSCPPKSRTGSQGSITLQNHEVDQTEVTGGSKSLNESIQVHNEVARTSVKEIPEKHIDASCFLLPMSRMPGGTTSSSNAKSIMPNLLSAASMNRPENSPLEVQDISQKDDKYCLPNSTSLRITKDNSNNSNSSLVGVSERKLTSKLVVSSITDKLPLKRKTFKEPPTDPKAASNTLKHINSSPKGRTTSSNTAKSSMPNLLSAASISSPKISPFEGQDIFQKDGKQHLPGLMTLRLRKANSPANSSMTKETNTVEETDGNLMSKSAISLIRDKPVLLSPPLKMKTLKEPLTDSKAFRSCKRMDSSSDSRTPEVISPEIDAEMVQREENPQCSKNDVSFENPSSLNGTTELDNMDIEMPSLIENHGNVEKAESCSKELDDLCNMLKKKHEEAKELLVRAIVNNNKLLMLNHPMIEEKIRALQRFAASLQSKEYRIL